MKSLLVVLFIVAMGWFTWKFLETQGESYGLKTICGQWSPEVTQTCGCTGYLKKSACPTGAECDRGTQVCYGWCGKCSCVNTWGTPMTCPGPQSKSDF
jgi:hypothetical protein